MKLSELQKIIDRALQDYEDAEVVVQVVSPTDVDKIDCLSVENRLKFSCFDEPGIVFVLK